MSRILVQDQPDHMIFKWPEDKVEISVLLLEEDRHHNESGEIRIFVEEEQIHRGRLNLTSIPTRKQLQNILVQQMADRDSLQEIDWYAILEELCSEGLDIFRRGEPIHVLGDVPEQERIKWRVEPLLLDAPTLVYGPGSSGKSMLAAYFAVLVQNGLGGVGGMNAEQGQVLYLDYETDSYEIASRVRLIQAALGIETPSDILYRFCSSPLVSEIDGIRKFVTEKNIDYVIVDSVGTACGGEPESADSVLRYFSALRSLKKGSHQAIGSLSISHTNREGTMFGSAYLTWQARSVYEVKKSQKPEESFIDTALHHRKSNNGQLIAPVGFRIDFDKEPGTDRLSAIRIYQRGLAEVEKLEGGASLRERLHVLLRDGIERTRDEVCEALNIGYQQRSNLRSVLSRYKNEFVVDETDHIHLATTEDLAEGIAEETNLFEPEPPKERPRI